MRYFITFKQKSLPPAGEILDFRPVINDATLYVGGIADGYGFDDLIDIFSELNTYGTYKLIIICREKDLYQKKLNKNEMENKYPWLSIEHASGKELEEYYDKAALCVLPKRNDESGVLYWLYLRKKCMEGII